MEEWNSMGKSFLLMILIILAVMGVIIIPVMVLLGYHL